MKIVGVSSIAEPDRFAVGTDLTTAFRNLTLSAVGEPDTNVIAADGFSLFLQRNFASTGSVVFGMDPPHPFEPQAWSEEFGLLRIDFQRSTDFVQIDLGADDDDWGLLSAYDFNGNLIATVTSGDEANRIGPGEYVSPSVSLPDAQIAYVTVGGVDDEGMWLDNLRFGVVGSSANDTMNGTGLDDHYNGLAGNDVLRGVVGNDTLLGGEGSDKLGGGDGDDQLEGGDGNDILRGRSGDDTLLGGDGDDWLSGGSGFNDLVGGDGDDMLVFTNDDFLRVHGGEGVDTLSFAKAPGAVGGFFFDESGGAADFFIDFEFRGVILEDAASDGVQTIERIIGSRHDDNILWDHTVYGGTGDDQLSGGSFGALHGQGGDDILRPAQNGDVNGGPGADVFVVDYFTGVPGLSNSDDAVIHDFKHGEDQIQFFGNPDITLTNEDDIWTLQSIDVDEQPIDITFQVVGITELQEGVDYTFTDSLIV